MATRVSSADQNQMQTWPGQGIQLPKDLDLRIFGFLKRNEMFTAMQTCKTWLDLTQDSQLWQREFALIGLEDQPDFARLSVNVRRFKELSQKGEQHLQEKVKTATEFDAAYYPLAYDKRIQQNERQRASDALEAEMDEKFKLQKNIEDGFAATLQLYKIGLKPLRNLESYASVLLERYGDERGWYSIADTHIEQNNEIAALNIIDRHFQKKYGRSYLIEKIIVRYCIANKFQEALDLLKRYSGDKYAELFQAPRMILAYAEVTKDLALIERVIDQIDCKNWKLQTIQNLIESHLDANQHEKAAALVIKYKTDLDQVERHEVPRLIEMYARLNQTEDAWSLARKNKEDDVIFYVLRNAFLSCGLNDEAEKVNKLLPKEED